MQGGGQGFASQLVVLVVVVAASACQWVAALLAQLALCMYWCRLSQVCGLCGCATRL